MGYTATWRILEDIIIELRKKGVTIPPNVMTDLKSAKLMINISQAEGSTGEVTQKVEEYLANVEGYLITEAQKTFGSERVDEWLRRLEAAICEVCEVKEKKKTSLFQAFLETKNGFASNPSKVFHPKGSSSLLKN